MYNSTTMDKIYISKDASPILLDYLREKNYKLEFIESNGIVAEPISNHPDIFLCKLGIFADSPVIFAETTSLSEKYPKDVAFNAACTGDFFIHNLNFTDTGLLGIAKAMGMKTVHVEQGYAKCSIVVVDERSIITYDEGIFKACQGVKGLDCLLVEPGHVNLPGYNTGFIGGASGRVGNEIIFNGDLSSHPNFEEIKAFIEERGLKCKWFSEYPLTDIGSII